MKVNKLTLLVTTIAALASSAFAAENPVPADYPLKKCPVSGEAYGTEDMVPVKVSHEGTDVWLCCGGCKKKFAKNPAKYTQMVKDAAAKK